MATPLGLRLVKVFTAVPANTKTDINNSGSFLYHEVTNGTGAEIGFAVNDFSVENGVPAVTIPIPPNSTRAIPMSIYNFKATGIVTVVSYGM